MKFIKPEFEKITLNELDVVLFTSVPGSNTITFTGEQETDFNGSDVIIPN